MVNMKRRRWKSEKSLERNNKNEIGTGSSKKFKIQQRIFHLILKVIVDFWKAHTGL